MSVAPIPPSSSWPLVFQAGKAAVPLFVTEPYPLPQPLPALYNDYELSTAVFRLPMTEYVSAYLGGRAMLTGGAAPDVVTGKTVYLFQEKRKQQGQTDWGKGLLDAWRLYVEHGDVPPEQWVADVLAKM
jgi:hypothetical protein